MERLLSIAFVTSNRPPIPPTLGPDDRLLYQSLTQHKTKPTVSVVSWMDTSIDWSNFDAIMLQSCFNYHLKASEFIAWVHRCLIQGKSKHCSVINNPEVVLWNISKHYLLELQEANFLIPKTGILSHSTSAPVSSALHEFSSSCPTIVIKPTISASAHNTFCLSHTEASRYDSTISTLLTSETDFLIQAFEPSIRNGEWSLIYLEGNYSHAVLKVPAQTELEFRCQKDFGGTVIDDVEPPKVALDVAERLVDWLQGKFGMHGVVDYMRVDGVVNEQGNFVLMEVECIEPELFYGYRGGAKAVTKFAEIILTRAKSASTSQLVN
ncbi:hypothetical protein OIDMADRAFT_148009 [Oidiodendron maius Zn]|uniref:Prokaryotic glutathione synthetase ATP-binding domain-containing protein n=1 Tax=Oidiodendron maius (strain Zn) TaxID=913774 RepID=A0A0C3GZY7_OIDMZ|nr:hypothetical protein OIDMADRAFT_148009 [Oidiodendron maius Zn]